jgi:hypothetical protein
MLGAAGVRGGVTLAARRRALRHSFATFALEPREDPICVARQLDDTLSICVELYGRRARMKPRFGGPNLIAADS